MLRALHSVTSGEFILERSSKIISVTLVTWDRDFRVQMSGSPPRPGGLNQAVGRQSWDLAHCPASLREHGGPIRGLLERVSPKAMASPLCSDRREWRNELRDWSFFPDQIQRNGVMKV